MRQAKRSRAELPLIELMYSRLRKHPLTFQEALAHASVAAQRVRARTLLGKSRCWPRLARAVQRMSDVDLDSAWTAALRGDGLCVEDRVLPHVDVGSQARALKGSPWRLSGWLSKRA